MSGKLRDTLRGWRRLAMDSSKSPSRELLLVFLVALGVRFLWAVVTPPWLGPDELQHFTYVAHVVENGELPRQGPHRTELPEHSLELQESCERTLCAQLSGLWEPGSHSLRHLPLLAPYARARSYRAPPALRRSQAGSTATVYLPPFYLYAAAFYRAVLDHSILTRMLAVRVASALLSALSCCFGYLLAHELTRKQSFGLAVGLLMALAPMHAFAGAAVNNDAAVCASGTLLCWLMAKVQNSTEVSSSQAATLGSAVGLVWLSKPTGFPVALMASLLMAWKTFPIQLAPLRLSAIRLRSVGAYAGATMLLVAPWLLYRRFTTPPSVAAGNAQGSLLSTLLEGGVHSFGDYLHDLFVLRGAGYFHWLLIKSFWGLFGWLELGIPERAYDTILLVYAASAVGLVLRVVREPAARRPTFRLLSLVLGQVVLLLVAADYLLSYAQNGRSLGMQGRYFFPVLAPLLCLLLDGISSLARNHAVVPRVAPLAMVALLAVSLGTMLSYYLRLGFD